MRIHGAQVVYCLYFISSALFLADALVHCFVLRLVVSILILKCPISYYLDTSGAQAVIEAHCGILSKLTRFIADKSLESYTYLKSTTNLDFEENTSFMTAYNVVDKSLVKKGDAPKIGTLADFKAYSNICGLLALNQDGLANLDTIFAAIQAVKATSEPSYD